MSQSLITKVNYDPFAYIEEAARYTPDFFSFSQSTYDEFPVVVVGSLRYGERNNNRLAGCNYYGPARTYQRRFIPKEPVGAAAASLCEPFIFDVKDFDKHTIQQNDIPKQYYDEELAGAVEGDLYGVSLRTLTELDRFCGNTEGFKRTREWVSMLHPKQEEASCQAFFYSVDLDFFLNIYDYTSDCMTTPKHQIYLSGFTNHKVYRT